MTSGKSNRYYTAHAIAIRQHEALERAVADLAHFIMPTADDLARLREALRDEAAKLYATSGHTFESALERVVGLARAGRGVPSLSLREAAVRRELAGDAAAVAAVIAADLAALSSKSPLPPPPERKDT